MAIVAILKHYLTLLRDKVKQDGLKQLSKSNFLWKRGTTGDQNIVGGLLDIHQSTIYTTNLLSNATSELFWEKGHDSRARPPIGHSWRIKVRHAIG